jgi:hypothetical protein
MRSLCFRRLIRTLIQINIQYTQKMMVQTAREILIALCKQLYVGLALFGCSLAGIPLTFEDMTGNYYEQKS